MIRFNILGIALFLLVVVLHPCTEGQVVPVVPLTPFSPRPLCNYQMALANQACMYLPFIQIPPPAPRAPFDPPSDDDDDEDEDTPEPEPRHEPVHRHAHEHRHVHDEDPDADADADTDLHHDDDPHHDDHAHDHGRGHEHDNEHNPDHGHGHGHKRRRHRRHINTPVEEQCCKWLAQVDDQCVCELLVHLPPFLARPVHNYAVAIGRACSFTFSCGSGFKK